MHPSGASGVDVNTSRTVMYPPVSSYDVKPPLDNKFRAFAVENSASVVPSSLSNGNSSIGSNNIISGDDKRCVFIYSLKEMIS